MYVAGAFAGSVASLAGSLRISDCMVLRLVISDSWEHFAAMIFFLLILLLGVGLLFIYYLGWNTSNDVRVIGSNLSFFGIILFSVYMCTYKNERE